eukprot:scaffold97482_cov28-Tisochrysis_lutea.AAC.4
MCLPTASSVATCASSVSTSSRKEDSHAWITNKLARPTSGAGGASKAADSSTTDSALLIDSLPTERAPPERRPSEHASGESER